MPFRLLHSISKPFRPAVLLAQAVLLVALWTNTAAIGQTASTDSTASRPAAASTVTSSAAATYRSTFEDYKPYTDEKVINWKQANDNTGRIGGWRAYAKEAQQPAQALQQPEAPTTPALAPKPNPHAGHGKP